MKKRRASREMGEVMGETDSANLPPPSGRKNEPTSSVRLKRAEQRRNPRFKTDEATVHLYIKKGLLTTLGIGRRNEARAAVNLSEGGILLATGTKLVQGTKVQVRIEIDKFNDVIETEGVIAWCFQSARDTSYYAGIEFRNLPAAQATLIGKMRSWFTSPEYKQKTATRKRLAPPELLQ